MILKNKIKKIVEAIKDTDIESIEISSFWGAQKIKMSKSAASNDILIHKDDTVNKVHSSVKEETRIDDLNNLKDSTEDNSSKENTEESTVDVDLRIIKAPLIGTYYESAKPGEPAFINIGQSIKPGQSLCIIEAMKIFNEIESEYSGEIIEILVNDGDPVEYGQPLFTLKES